MKVGSIFNSSETLLKWNVITKRTNIPKSSMIKALFKGEKQEKADQFT